MKETTINFVLQILKSFKTSRKNPKSFKKLNELREKSLDGHISIRKLSRKKKAQFMGKNIVNGNFNYDAENIYLPFKRNILSQNNKQRITY